MNKCIDAKKKGNHDNATTSNYDAATTSNYDDVTSSNHDWAATV